MQHVDVVVVYSAVVVYVDVDVVAVADAVVAVAVVVAVVVFVVVVARQDCIGVFCEAMKNDVELLSSCCRCGQKFFWLMASKVRESFFTFTISHRNAKNMFPR